MQLALDHLDVFNYEIDDIRLRHYGIFIVSLRNQKMVKGDLFAAVKVKMPQMAPAVFTAAAAN